MENKRIFAGTFTTSSKTSNNLFPCKQIQVQAGSDNSSISSTEKQMDSPFLLPFINMHAYFLIFPFRVVYSSESGKFVASTSRLRKVLCGLFHVFVLFFNALGFLPAVRIFVTSRRNVSSVLYVTSYAGAVVGTFVLLKVAWTCIDSLIKLVNLTSVACPNSQKQTLSKLLAGTTCILVVASHLLQGVFSSHRHAGAAQTFNDLKSVLAPVFSFIGFNPYSWLGQIFGFGTIRYIGLVTFSYFCCFMNMAVAAFLILVLTMEHVINNNLMGYLKECDNELDNIVQVMRLYERVKETADQLKNIFNGYIICYYIMTLSFFGLLPQVVLNSNADQVNSLIMCGYLLIICVSMYIAVRANMMLEESIKNFIQRCHHQIHITHENAVGSMDKRLMLIAWRQDMENDPVGVSCSFFTITKKFLSSTISLVATYALIIMQLPNEKPFWEEDSNTIKLHE